MHSLDELDDLNCPPAPTPSVEMIQLPLLESALDYAFRGMRVLPCHPRDKKPPLIKEWQKQATTNATQVRKWWGEWPDANVAIATGQGSGVFVLDIDLPCGPDELRKLEAQNGPLPPTLTQRTGGGGLQMFFRYPVGRKVVTRAGILGTNLDVRGEGGYVIMPPSVHPSGKKYTWESEPNTPVAVAPEWFLQLVCATAPAHADTQKYPLLAHRPIVEEADQHGRKAVAEEAPAPPELDEPGGEAAHSPTMTPASPHAGTGRTAAWARAAFEAEVREVANAQEGTRNDALNKAAFALGSLVAGGVLDESEVEKGLYHAARQSGLDGPEIGKTITSGLEAGKRHPRSQPPGRVGGAHHGPGDGNELDIRPTLQVLAGETPFLTDRCEEILLAADLPIYQRAGALVRVAALPAHSEEGGVQRSAGSLVLTPVNRAWLCDILGRAVQFMRSRGRSGELIPCDTPIGVADALLARAGAWKFPTLRGILAGPSLRADGSVLGTVGYDAATGYYLGSPMHGLDVKDNPTLEDAQAALGSLRKLIQEFPFVAEMDEAVALALLLTSVCRPAVTRAPMFAVTSPVRGSGKSLLIDLAAMLSTGRQAAVLAAGGGAEELDKRLGASLLAGDELISLDNFSGVIRSDLLCQATTQDRVRLRVLGTHEQRELSCTAIWCATGNNLALAGDLTRRALLVRLDPRCERPEQRRFKSDPITAMKRDRAHHVGQALTILRAYHVGGEAGTLGLSPLNSFGDWSRLVRGALVWLGLPDPALSMNTLQVEDPDAELLSAFLHCWHGCFGSSALMLREAVRTAKGTTDIDTVALHDLLEEIAPGTSARSDINCRRLASWLQGQKGRIIDGLRLDRSPQARGGAFLWKVTKLL